jgi:streptomycin 6-kinase
VLAHGDPHAWKTLLDPKTNQYKLVDPDGLFTERAHDLNISMRVWIAELLAAGGGEELYAYSSGPTSV